MTMNVARAAEMAKDLSQEQLMAAAQYQMADIPPYMALAEMQRRKRLTAEQQAGPMPTSTVMQDMLAAPGVPSGGLTQLAGAMAPKTDMAKDTGVTQAPQGTRRMAEGGYYDGDTKRYAGGRSVVIDGQRYDIDPAVAMLAENLGMTPEEYLRRNPAAAAQSQRRIERNQMLELEPMGGGITFPTQADLDRNYRDEAVGIGSIPSGLGEPSLSAVPNMPTPSAGPVFDVRAPALQSPATEVPRGGNWFASDGSLGAVPVNTDQPLNVGGYTGINTASGDGQRYSWGDNFTPAGFAGRSLAELEAIANDPNATEGERQAASIQLSMAQGAEDFGRYATDTLTGATNAVSDAVTDAVALPVRVAGSGMAALGIPGADKALGAADWLARFGQADGNEGTYEDGVFIEGTPTGDLSQPRPQARDDAAVPPNMVEPAAPVTPPGGGGSGSARGAGAASTSSTQTGPMDDMARQLTRDKWLALAEFGLGLMSSNAPTLGKAIGEAGLPAVQSMRAAQENYNKYKLADRELQQQMAIAQMRAASGGGGGGADFGDLLRLRGQLIEQLGDPMITAGDRVLITEQLAGVNAVLGLGGRDMPSYDAATEQENLSLREKFGNWIAGS